MTKQKIGKLTIPQEGTQFEKIMSELRMLDLPMMAASFEEIGQQVEMHHGTIYDYLQQLLEVQLSDKEEARKHRWAWQAGLPKRTAIRGDGVTFQPQADKILINELATCRFIEQGKNVFLLGAPGVGKSYLATALGYEAIDQGYVPRFMKLNEFIKVIKLKADDSLKRFHHSLVSADVLILDDIDFYTANQEAAEFLYQVIDQRYEDKKSTIFTSNHSPHEWGNVFGERNLPAALDRIRMTSRLIDVNFKGAQSLRTPEVALEETETAPPQNHGLLHKVAGAFSRE